MRAYFGAFLIGNLVWESLQLPLYAIWREGSPGEPETPASLLFRGQSRIAQRMVKPARSTEDAIRTLDLGH